MVVGGAPKPETLRATQSDGISVCASASSIRASAMSCKRRVQSFSRHRRSRRCNGAGAGDGSRDQSGSRSTIAASVSANVLLPNALVPVNISYSTHPNDQISVRLSTVKPLACSGLIYAAVPSSVPDCVSSDFATLVAFVPPISAPVSRAFATPKSSTLMVPSGPHLNIRGFQIAMDDSSCVRSLECVGNLPGNRKHFEDGKPTIADPFEQRVALDELENEDLSAFRRTLKTGHGADIRMTDGRKDARFASEARDAVSIERKSFWEQFERHVTA